MAQIVIEDVTHFSFGTFSCFLSISLDDDDRKLYFGFFEFASGVCCDFLLLELG